MNPRNFVRPTASAAALALAGSGGVVAAAESLKKISAKTRARSIHRIPLIPIFLLLGHSIAGATVVDYVDPAMSRIHIEVPAFKGTQYEAMVPDTLDLAERAKLAINAMTRTLDPAHEHELYFIADLAANPPMQIHEGSSVFVETKYSEALPLCRVMTGDLRNLDVDKILMEKYIRHTGKDGFVYFPVGEFPWRNTDPYGNKVVPPGNQSHSWTEARALGTILVWQQRDNNPLWSILGNKKVDRFLEAGAREGDAISFGAFYKPGQTGPAGIYPAPLGIVRYARVSGYKPAAELARLYVNYLKNRYFPGGKFTARNHQWSATGAVIDIMEYAQFTQDHETMKWVENAYEKFRTPETGGNALVGFFGEGPMKDYPSCEACCVAAMLQLALKLSIYGAGDYWDDADRYIRNMFTEMQMTNASWVELRRPAALPQAYVDKIADQNKTGAKNAGMIDTNDTAERCVGAWAGWAIGNDGMCLGHEQNHRPYTFMHCCTGNAARVLYYAWDSILTGDQHDLRVNLLLNRASSYLDVNSYVPYSGRVDLKVKSSLGKLQVRIPEWVTAEQTLCSVNGHIVKPEFHGRYAQLGAVEKGDMVVVTFPISSRQVKTRIGGIDYNLEIKGNEVIAIDPQGKWWPIYQKEQYRQNQVRWVRRERFVSSEKIAW